MAINGISTQQVSGISPNAGVSANGGASIESVSNAISAAANKGITPAGPTVTERDSRGSTYGFTPYHDAFTLILQQIQTITIFET